MGVMLGKLASFFKQLVFRLILLIMIIFIIAYYFYFYKPSDIGLITGKIRDFNLCEVSGLVVSEKNADTLWVHNDSGHSSSIYAISKRGNIRDEFDLQNTELEDIEDIALYKDELGESYIIVADLGSNTKMRSQYRPRLIIFKEPDLLSELSKDDEDNGHVIKSFHSYVIQFPQIPNVEWTEQENIFKNIVERIESDSPNIEAFVVDSMKDELIFLTKTYKGQTDVLSIAFSSLKENEPNILRYIGTIDIRKFTEGYHVDYRHSVLSPINLPYAVTGADLSKDQKSILVRTYGNVWKWNRGYSQKPFSDIIVNTKPEYIISSFEPLGESIGFDIDDKGFYTISEGFFSKIYYNELP